MVKALNDNLALSCHWGGHLVTKDSKDIHEPLDLQRKDVLQIGEDLAGPILAGEDCDFIRGGHGDFGCLTNPIPVNGAVGEIKYLGKLRGRTGKPLFFHRLFGTDSPVSEHRVDVYETVCIDATQWKNLHLDMYHPRRSNIAPLGYSLAPYNPDRGADLPFPFGFGIDRPIENFPYGVVDLMETWHKSYGVPPVEIISFVRIQLAKLDFSRR